MLELAGLDAIRGWADARGFGLLPDNTWLLAPVAPEELQLLGIPNYIFGWGGAVSAVDAAAGKWCRGNSRRCDELMGKRTMRAYRHSRWSVSHLRRGQAEAPVRLGAQRLFGGTLGVLALTILVGVALPHPAEARQGVEPTPDQVRQALEGGWSHSNLQPRGQPVIPVFDGWFQNEDGTYDLCFGFHNLNTEEILEIPLGPSNFIDPPEFDGLQPTRFDPVPGPERQLPRRHWCVFTVTVPEDFGDRDVVWTIRSGGELAFVAGQRRPPEYSVPGRITSSHYELDEPDQRGAGDMDGVEAPPGRVVRAPTVRVASPASGDEWLVEARGRGGMVMGRGFVTAVDEPIEITSWVDPDANATWLWWNKHQGPGNVTFGPAETRLDDDPAVRTMMSFSSPGVYLLRGQAVSAVGDLEFQCCWTNIYVQVEVTD